MPPLHLRTRGTRAARALKPGYTLLELVMVMVVAGVLMMLVAPRLVAVRDTLAVRGAMGELGTALASARELAIARRALVSLVIDTASGTVRVRSAGHTPSTRALHQIYGVRLASNRDSAVFDPRGLGFGVSNMTVTIRRGAFVDTLTMSRLGRARW